MKCMRNIATGKVDKVTDEIASRRASKGTHQFVARKVWREEVRGEIKYTPGMTQPGKLVKEEDK